MKIKEEHLNCLISQWEESAKLGAHLGGNFHQQAIGIMECVEELKELLGGSVSPIERWDGKHPPIS